MRKGRVLNFKIMNGLFSFLSKNKALLSATVFYIAGLFLGVFSYSKNSSIDNFNLRFLESFIEVRSDTSFLKIFIDSFFSAMTSISVFFVLGASMFGMIAIPFIIMYKGFSYGAVAALLYNTYALKGIAFNTVLILPSALLLSLILLWAFGESVNFSFILARLTFFDTEKTSINQSFKRYCLKYLSFVGFAVIVALSDALISYNFMEKFKL